MSESGAREQATGDVVPEGKKLIYGGIAAFVATCAVLIAVGPMLTPTIDTDPPYDLSPVAVPSPDGTFEVTFDVSDTIRWIPFSFGIGQITLSENVSDIAVRRYLVRTADGALDLGQVDLADAAVPADADWVPDNEVDGALQNKALADWYDYSYWTHTLNTKHHTYAVKRRGGGVAYFQIVSYYCKPDGTGCLTLRYRIED